jgi:hypothetical protein
VFADDRVARQEGGSDGAGEATMQSFDYRSLRSMTRSWHV